jgi:alpha-beta hydrolase superfamily lysophospholipase
VEPDILGAAYEARTLQLTPDAAGENVAVLVHRPAEAEAAAAILYVHGYGDYFFQDHVAEHFTAQGIDFYAVDLRGYGRSLLAHQLPNYVTDLGVHFEELDAAARVVSEEHPDLPLVVLAHSTGGLTAALWAHERREDGVVDALVLNSPWLDHAESWPKRTFETAVVDAVARLRPQFVVRGGLSAVYGHSSHRSSHGEWDYRLDWKPLANFPVRAGWLTAVRRGHARLHRGLDVSVPVLVLHSARSLLHGDEWTEDAMSADTVLDVAQIAHWAPKIGRNVTVVAVDGGLHDLFLSAGPVRRQALAAVDSWLSGAMEPAP